MWHGRSLARQLLMNSDQHWMHSCAHYKESLKSLSSLLHKDLLSVCNFLELWYARTIQSHLWIQLKWEQYKHCLGFVSYHRFYLDLFLEFPTFSKSDDKTGLNISQFNLNSKRSMEKIIAVHGCLIVKAHRTRQHGLSRHYLKVFEFDPRRHPHF